MTDAPSRRGLTPEACSALARIALGHVTREYPNKLDHVLAGPGDAQGPRALHPIFFGSYDWHSCVHGYWTLATILRHAPAAPEAEAIRTLFGEAFTAAKVEGELAYLRRPGARGFERPYGWAWLLKLQSELLAHAGTAWAARLQPLADAFAARFHEHLPNATYPVRSGAHANTAFALALAADYARAAGDQALLALFERKARDWYLGDRDAPAWEPSGEDFLSPTLVEAECMRRLLPADEHRAWLARFLPRAVERSPAPLFSPAFVSDRTDGRIVHLDGLNLSRAWCWREMAAALPAGDTLGAVAVSAAEAHLDAALPYLSGDYMGEHWLASFALLALTAGED